jgi:thiol-disulfide isomerase/thioredoxin
MAGTVEDVRDENYKEFTDSPGAVVAYGLATCEPCKTYDPILEETAAKFPGIKVGKAKMHVPGRCREIKKTHTFETYPTTPFFAMQALPTREGVVEPANCCLISDHLVK